MSVNYTDVLCQVTAAREGLVAPRAVCDRDRPIDRPPAYLRKILGRLSAVHRRHVVAEEGGGLHNGVALGTAESAVRFPHVEGEGHATAEELRTLVTMELYSAVHQIAVLVEIRTVGKGFLADVT